MGWQLATFGLFRTASVVCPKMEERGKGVIMVTSATAAVRGNAGRHSHAAAMGGRRIPTLPGGTTKLFAMAFHMGRGFMDRLDYVALAVGEIKWV